jgi:hypothetical protein
MSAQTGVTIRLEAEDRTQGAFASAKSGLAGLGSGLSDIGSVALGVLGGNLITGGISKITGAFSEGMSGAREAATVFAQSEAVIKSTGNSAGVTAEQVRDYAGSLSDAAGKSLFSGEQVSQSENLLLTFTNIKGKTLEAATAMSVNLAQAMGGAPKDSAIQLGKALNDPEKGITALTRVGVTFDDQQKKLIKTYQEHGEMAKAQAVILGELNKEFGGSAEAAAAAAGGGHQFKAALDDAVKGVAGAFLPALDKVGSLLSSPAILGGMQHLADLAANGLTKGIDIASNAFSTILHIIGVVSDEIKSGGIMQGLVALVEELGNLGPIGDTVSGVLANMLDPIAAVGAAFTRVGSWITATGLPALQNFGGFIQGTVIPTIQGLASQFVSNLQPSVQNLSDLWTGTLQPGIAALATFLTGTLIPGVSNTVTTLSTMQSGTVQLSSVVGNITQTINGLTSALVVVVDWVKQHTAAQAVLVAGLTAYGTVVALSTAATIAQTVATTATSAATGVYTAAQWLLNAALTANPIGIVVVALAGLTAGLVYAYNNSETFRSGVNSLASTIQSIAVPALGAIKGAVDAVSNAVSSAIAGVQNLIGAISRIHMPDIHLPSIPGFATGVQNYSGGLALVGEQGPELVTLPPGSSVYTNQQTRSMMAGSGSGGQTIINVYQQPFQSMSDLVNMITSAQQQQQRLATQR